MMTLDDLRRLDPQTIGSWPALPKLGILVLAFIGSIVASYFLDWQGQLEAIDAVGEKRTDVAHDIYRQEKTGDRS